MGRYHTGDDAQVPGPYGAAISFDVFEAFAV
jgi:hypothetical protein